MPDDERHESIWNAIDELRRFRVRTLLGLLTVATLAGIAWGVETNRVSNHIGQDGIHITMAQATTTAERLTKMEQSIKANTDEIGALKTAINKQREASAANTQAILDAINKWNDEEVETE